MTNELDEMGIPEEAIDAATDELSRRGRFSSSAVNIRHHFLFQQGAAQVLSPFPENLSFAVVSSVLRALVITHVLKIISFPV